MALEFKRSESSSSPIEKELIATNGTTYAHGVLVGYGSAGTAVTTGTEYVYVGKDITAKTGDILACVPILPEYEFETEFSADASALKAGTKVTIAAGKATATTASGIFEILADGGVTGASIVGRFS